MSLTNSKLSVEQITPDSNVTYFVTLQAATTGKSAVDYVSPLLTYNTGLGKFFVNNRIVPTSNVVSLGSVVTSPTPPPIPNVGDLWYDTTSDTQFEYVYDGVNYQWVDVTGPTMSIGGPVSTNNFTYLPFTATANPTTTRNLNAGDPVNFSTFTSVTGGYTVYPYTYYIASGTLPIGLTLNPATGVVSGIAQRAYTTASVVFGVRDILNFAATTSVTFNVVLNIQYLVVAGGGGGGADRGSGGGAGGLRFGSVTCLSNGTTITIRVGAGGAPGVGPAGKGANGHSSNIVSSAFGTVSTVGGGGGGSVNSGPAIPQNGFAGGSGGGAGGQPQAINPSSGTFGAGTFGAGTGFPGTLGSTQQGFPGGLSGSNTPGAPPCGLYGAGGGGGAGAAGGNGIGPLRAGGAGGIGYLWPYTNSYYAGGGGGSFCSGGPTQPGIPGPGGLGGGGAGANSMINGTAGTPGTANFGGGGGGGAGSVPQGQGGVGGSGTVIIIIPTPAYFSGTTNGSVATTPPAAPGYTALTYSATNPTTPSVFIFTT